MWGSSCVKDGALEVLGVGEGSLRHQECEKSRGAKSVGPRGVGSRDAVV